MPGDQLTRGSSEAASGLRSAVLRGLERLSGAHRYRAVYDKWRTEIARSHPQKMNELLRMLGVRLSFDDAPWPPQMPANAPLVMIANHPYGIADGIVLAAMAETLERPYKVLINTEFLRIEAFRDHCLPIDFGNSKEAMQINLATRKEALRLLQEGVVLLVFPAGAVATAARVFGRAQEAPWKTFTASLVRKAQASVLPVFFEGQNSLLFHAASHVSASARLSLLIAEFRRLPGSTLAVHAGAVVPFSAMQAHDGRQALTDELFLQVHRLAPWAQGLPDAAILPPDWLRKRPYRWDRPLGR